MNAFHNPYHFVPLRKDREHDEWIDAGPYHADKRKDNPYLPGGHSRYEQGRHKGRIRCTLITETPVFIGARRYQEATETNPARVAPYELGGQPAIPATTLRGMISSIAEAASYSAMRVLDDRSLSRRADMFAKESLGAIGLLKKDANGEDMQLLPLTLPPMQNSKPEPIWKRVFCSSIGLLVYLDGYEPAPNDHKKIRYKANSFLDREKQLSWSANSFLDREKPLSWSANNQQYWYMQLGAVGWDRQDPAKVFAKFRHHNHGFLLGQKASSKLIVEQPRSGYTRGILRVLGIDGREKDIPTGYNNKNEQVGKKHEIFIPYPEDESKQNPLLDATEALKNFHRLCDERADKEGYLPFHLKGMERTRIHDVSTIRLKEGDLVCFDVKEAEDGNIIVSELSISSLWRKAPRYPERNLAPFNTNRQLLSPAERVFGFVEDRPKGGDGSKDAGTAYAGHVRFSHARWDGNLPQGKDSPYGSEVILKILDSPKPPSPALYFRKREGNSGYIAKQELDPDKHEIQGRKFYLHHGNSSHKPWKTHLGNRKKRLKQKTCITPLHDKLSFSFEVEYDNLTEFELGMLLYALSPNDSFWHKIGMGKPLGLGSVKIGIDEVVCHDPLSQYRGAGPFGERCEEKKEDWGTVRDAFRKKMMEIAPATVQALETLGDPNATGGHPVHYPQKAGKSEAAFEEEHYRWWVKNDHKDTHPKQHLAPLDENEFNLKPLKRN